MAANSRMLLRQPTSRGFTHRVGECTTLRQYVNAAEWGPCWKCGGDDESHTPEAPRDNRLRPERGGVDAIVALGLGMRLQWAPPEDAHRA